MVIQEVQRLIDRAFAERPILTRTQLVDMAHHDAALHPDEEEWFTELPEGSYTRRQLVDKLNSIIARLDPELTKAGPPIR